MAHREDQSVPTEQELTTRFDTRVVSAVGLLGLLAVAVSVVSIVAPDVAETGGFKIAAAAVPALLWLLRGLFLEDRSVGN